MLRSAKQLEGFAIGATDGPIGKVKDFYFDDEAWVIRYLVADTTKWLGGRDVLISLYSLGHVDWAGETLPVTVTKEQVRNSPGVDSDLPVSRQYERSYLGYYGYPYYWGGGGLWGPGFYPGSMPMSMGLDPYDRYQGYLRAPTSRDSDKEDNDPHLRSCNAVRGHHLVATDGEIGHVQGFLLDDATWSIRYLIVDTSNWWMGHQVLVSPEWIDSVNWPDSTVTVNLRREQVKDAPPYDASQPFDRDSEGALYRHYNRNGYWRDPPARAA
jgi:hypothetical protein